MAFAKKRNQDFPGDLVVKSKQRTDAEEHSLILNVGESITMG